MDAIGRLHHAESAVIDRIRHHVAPRASDGIALVFGDHVHMVPPAVGAIVSRIDRNFVQILPMNQVWRFIEPKQVIVRPLVRESPMVQDELVPDLSDKWLPYAVVLKALRLQNNAVVLPANSIAGSRQPYTITTIHRKQIVFAA